MPAAVPDVGMPAASYSDLDGAWSADLAWEWLRRDPNYRRTGHQSALARPGGVTIAEGAEPDCTMRWGCLNLPDPDLSWREAPILWSSAVDPSVLKVLALPPSTGTRSTFDLLRCGVRATLVSTADCEHVLLHDGSERVRLDVLSGSLLDGPTWLTHDLAGPIEVEPTFAALHRFIQLREQGCLPRRRSRSGQQWRRQVLALRVHDARVRGASIREVGEMLFGIDRVRSEWAGEALKSQCRRLIDLAREMASGGYRTLLQR
jgi:hypothetical protein